MWRLSSISSLPAVDQSQGPASAPHAEAFEMVKNKRYSLIMLDIKMPGASGIELYGRMQKIAQSFAERVIFITGDIMGTATEAFLSKTKAPYITKPFDVNQLKKTI